MFNFQADALFVSSYHLGKETSLHLPPFAFTPELEELLKQLEDADID